MGKSPSTMEPGPSTLDHNRMVAALGSPDIAKATNAAGILCTVCMESQCIRTAVSSSEHIVSNIELALGGSADLPHNAALLVSMLSTVTSFRRSFVRSAGLRLLVDLLNKSQDPGEQCNLLYALVALATAGRDCHTELYDLLVKSGMAWVLVRTLMQSPDLKVQENARALAEQLRKMPSSLALERTGSSDAVHTLALLSCDNRTDQNDDNFTPNNAKTNHWSPSSRSPSRKRGNRVISPISSQKRKLDIPGSSPEVKDFVSLPSPRGGLAALASLVLSPSAVG